MFADQGKYTTAITRAIRCLAVIALLLSPAVRAQEGPASPPTRETSAAITPEKSPTAGVGTPADDLGEHAWDATNQHTTALLDHLYNSGRQFGNWVDSHAAQSGHAWLIYPLSSGITVARVLASLALLGVVGLINFVLLGLLQKYAGRLQSPEHQSWPKIVGAALRKPLGMLIWLHGAFFSSALLLDGLERGRVQDTLFLIATNGTFIGLCIAIFWVLIRFIRGLEKRMLGWARRSGNLLEKVLVPLAARALRLTVPLLGIITVAPAFHLSEANDWIIRKLIGIFLIGAIAHLIIRATVITQQVAEAKYRRDVEDNLTARKIYTQITVLRKLVVVLVTSIAVACMLMLFDPVRQVGTSILASAGIAGVAIGFAAQKILGNFLAGIQIALTQPIRIDDVVIVENEWGWIEEITLTYVVVRVWDWRRLVLPISYFIEKPFQNWTRNSSELIGTVFLHVDYKVPVEALRQELKRLVQNNQLWDGKVVSLQVTALREQTMEIRCLASSPDAPKGWDLRCELREQMIDFIRREYPDSLPRLRAELTPAPQSHESQPSDAPSPGPASPRHETAPPKG